MKTQHDIEMFIQNEPLIEGKLSLQTVQWPQVLSTKEQSLFFGIGLCTSKQPAVGMPFDILAFFLEAERIRRFLNLPLVIVLIADTHALTNSFMTQSIVQEVMRNTTSTLQAVIRNLHLTNFRLLRSSEFTNNPEFVRMIETLPSFENQYLHRELADMIWLQKKHNVMLKLGWTINNSIEPGGHDERFFDTKIHDVHQTSLSFLYTKAGRTFDPKKPKASPYISTEGESRILLTEDENVSERFKDAESHWGKSAMQPVKNHLSAIVRSFEESFVRLPFSSLEEKIQFIINTATKT